MIPFLQFSYQNIYPNFGLGIIILTILVKLVLYPVTKQQFESMKKKEMMPTFKKLEKHKDNPQQLQMETMKIYKEHKINPLGYNTNVNSVTFLFALFYNEWCSFEALISQSNVFPGLTSFGYQTYLNQIRIYTANYYWIIDIPWAENVNCRC